MKTYIL